MRVRVVTAPAPLLEWDAVKARLRLDDDAAEPDVMQMVGAATTHIDGPSGWLGRALGPQTLEATFDSFDELWRDMPCAPVIDVESVTYLDATGVSQTLSSSAYELVNDRLLPVIASYWPTTYWSPAWSSCGGDPHIVPGGRPAVTIRYRAGYAADPAADPLVAAVPDPIVSAILLLASHWNSNRDAAEVGLRAAAIEVPFGVEALLAAYRVYR